MRSGVFFLMTSLCSLFIFLQTGCENTALEQNSPECLEFERMVFFLRQKSFLGEAKSKSYEKCVQGLKENVTLVELLQTELSEWDPFSRIVHQDEIFQAKNMIYSYGFSAIQKKSNHGSLLEISEVLQGSPAEKAGMVEGMHIVNINGKNLSDLGELELNFNAKRLDLDLSFENKTTHLSLEPDHFPLSWFKLEMFNIPVKMAMKKAKSVIKDKNKTKDLKNAVIGYLKIRHFFENTSPLIEVLKMFRKTVDFLILDLRDNPGGELQKALELGSYLGLESGPFVKLFKPSVNLKSEVLKNIPQNTIWNLEKLVVLTNERTRSSAEVLAGALQDYGAVLLGRTTYGKGSYQELISLSQFQSKYVFPEFVYLTTALTLRPSGQWIEKNGITPDLFIPNLSALALKVKNHKSLNLSNIQVSLNLKDRSPLEGWSITQDELRTPWIQSMQTDIQEMANTPEIVSVSEDFDLEVAKRISVEKMRSL